jgi:hypothetical protein
MTRDELVEQTGDPDLLFLDPPALDAALIGCVERYGMESVALYDLTKLLAIFEAEGMTPEEAEEHWSFNVVGAWAGDRTPAFATLHTRGENGESGGAA